MKGLEYREWINGNVRVYSGIAWIEVTRDGEVVNQNKQIPGFMMDTFPADMIAEAVETVKSLKPAPYKTAYLRFNDLPKGGRSKNFATGKMENGVSCCALVWDTINQCYVRTGNGLDGAMLAYTIQGAPMYLISGDECGTGSDGEPLVKNAKVLGSVKYDTSKSGYVMV